MQLQKLSVLVLRVAVGVAFLDMGVTMFKDPTWSLVPFMNGAKLFSGFYSSLASSSLLPYLTYGIKGLFLIIGILLVLGLFVRLASLIGIVLMFFLYVPLLAFPYICVENIAGPDCAAGMYYLVDMHVIYAAALFVLFAMRAGDVFGLGTMFRFSRY